MDREILFEMLNTMSVSGREFDFQKVVLEHMKKYADNCLIDQIGNVISVLNGDSDFRIMLAAHCDEIGLMISRIRSDGRCYLEEVGSITYGVYPGQIVQIKTKDGFKYGVIAKLKDIFERKIEESDLLLDLGVDSFEAASKIVEVGDVLVQDSQYRMITDDVLAARALDDKIGLYAINEAFKKAKSLGCKIGLYSTSTVGEETTKRGAIIASRRICPSMAIVVDVGTDTSSLNDIKNSNYRKNGGGPILATGTTMNKPLEDIVRKIAIDNGINLQFETVVYRSYTDADSIYLSDFGVPTTLISIPLRYMHSAGEMVNMKDVDDIINLITHVIMYFDQNYKNIDFIPIK